MCNNLDVLSRIFLRPHCKVYPDNLSWQTDGVFHSNDIEQQVFLMQGCLGLLHLWWKVIPVLKYALLE